MPTVTYEAKRLTPNISDVIPGTLVNNGIVVGNVAKILAVGPDGVTYNRNSTVLAAAIFETQTIPMAALNEVFGLSVQATYSNAPKVDAIASVQVQVTIDGTNYLAWDGAAWSVSAVGGTYNSLGEFNDNCATLSLLNPRQLGFRVRLTNFNGDTPLLRSLNAVVEWESEPYFDLFPTLKDIIESRLEIPITRRYVNPTVGATFMPLDSNYTPVPNGTFSAYNLTADPNKNANIFLQYDAANSRIQFTGPQALDSLIEYSFEGTCDVDVVRPDELVEVSELPTTLVVIGDLVKEENRMVGKIAEYKLGTNTKRVRTRFHPVFRSCSVTVQHWARTAREAIKAINRIEKVFDQGVVLLSTGEKLNLVVESEATFRDLSSESYYSGSFVVRISFYEHIEEYEEFGVVTQINANFGSFDQDWPDDGVVSGG